MHISDLPDEVLIYGDSEETIFSQMLSQTGRLLPQANAIVMNFYEELNPPLLIQDLKSKFQNLFNVGFLTLSLPPSPLPRSDSDPTCCLSWLDKKNDVGCIYKLWNIGHSTTWRANCNGWGTQSQRAVCHFSGLLETTWQTFCQMDLLREQRRLVKYWLCGQKYTSLFY